MAIDRRQFLISGAALAVLAPSVACGAAGASQLYLTAFNDRVGNSYAGVIDGLGDVHWRVDLPARGHDLALRPGGREVALTARRPGRFARVLETATGREIARFDAPEGRNFNGHCVYSSDGRTLFTTENVYDEERGAIGMWDATDGYARLGEVDSGGLDPHQLVLLTDGSFVIANGGLLMHPDTGRTVLNVPEMRSSLAVVDPKRNEVVAMMDCHAVAPYLCLHHLDITGDGSIVVAGQAQTPMAEGGPLLIAWRPGEEARTLEIPENAQAKLEGYMGSVAVSRSGRYVASTSPRGGMMFVHRAGDGVLVDTQAIVDVCGVSASQARADGFVFTSGTGATGLWTPESGVAMRGETAFRWDNHLSPLASA